MARVRNGGGAASAWAAVIFGVGFVICLILSILFYVQRNDAQQTAQEAEQQLRTYISASEESSPTISELRSAGGSVVGTLLERNQSLKGMISSPDASFEALQQQKQNLEVTGPLFNAVQQLQASLNSREQQIAELEQDIEQAREEVASAQEQSQQVRQQYQDRFAELEGRLETVQQQFDQARDRLSQMEQELGGQFQQTRQEHQQQVNDYQNQVADLQNQISELNRALEEARAQNSGLRQVEALRADGRITSVSTGGEYVYIDLGEEHQLIRGLTFEVFDGTAVVKPNADETDVRGKATIEVVDIGDDRAMARVVRRSQGAAVRENDQIINVAYDADSTYRFFVYGDFSVRSRSEAGADNELIRSIIRQWGGELADEMSYQVDFLVLGQEPTVPQPLPASETDPARIRAHSRAVEEYEQYQELAQQARKLQIPVLNQNRFLSLVGFYQR